MLELAARVGMLQSVAEVLAGILVTAVLDATTIRVLAVPAAAGAAVGGPPDSLVAVAAVLGYSGKAQMGLVEVTLSPVEAAVQAVKLDSPVEKAATNTATAGSLAAALAQVIVKTVKAVMAQFVSYGPEQPVNSHLPTLVRHKD